ncbi:Uncharacterised protein [Vibrio cholerae]|nr:Uncharacterised protein [Vibrio cholerae]
MEKVGQDTNVRIKQKTANDARDGWRDGIHPR